DRSRERAKIWCNPVGQYRKHWYAYRFRCFGGQAFRQNTVHTQAQVRVLFGTAQWQYGAIVAPQIFFHHHPIHFADSHAVSSPVDLKNSRRFVNPNKRAPVPSSEMTDESWNAKKSFSFETFSCVVLPLGFSSPCSTGLLPWLCGTPIAHGSANGLR